MADAVNDEGFFYRGTGWIAHQADMPERTVQKKIKYLIEKEYLHQTVKSSPGRRATYRLTELTHADSADASHYKNNYIEPKRNQTINNHPLPSPNGGEILPKNTAVDSAEDDDDGNKNNVIDWINKNYPNLINIWKRDFKAPPSANCLSAIYEHRGNIGEGFPAAHIEFMKSQNVTTPDKYLVKRIRGRAPLLVRDLAAQKTTRQTTNRMI